MIYLKPTDVEDLPQIRDWTAVDVYHKDRNSPEWWLTGNGLLSFCVHDTSPVFYIRLDKNLDDDYIRWSTQFAPSDIVKKIRVAKSLIKVLPVVIEFSKKQKSKGLIFSSSSPSLIKFMSKLGFKESDGDFMLTFGE